MSEETNNNLGRKVLIKKYGAYINNLKWNIKEGNASGERLIRAKNQLECFTEVLKDIKEFIPETKELTLNEWVVANADRLLELENSKK